MFFFFCFSFCLSISQNQYLQVLTHFASSHHITYDVLICLLHFLSFIYLDPPTNLIMYDGGTASTTQVTATEVIRNGESFMFTCKAQDAHPGTVEVAWTLTNVGTFTDVETDPANGALFDVVSTISETAMQSYCGQTLRCTATHTETSTTLTASTTLDVTCKLFNGNLHPKQKFSMFCAISKISTLI